MGCNKQVTNRDTPPPNRLEEFLRRKLRLQRVEEEVRRRIVLGFFDMLYYSRQFKRHMETKRAGRMTAIPQLDVPEILVDNEEQRAEEEQQRRQGQGQGQGQGQQMQPPTPGGGGARSRAKSSAAATVLDSDSLLSPSTSRARSQHRSWAAGLGADLSSYDTSYGHPLAGPRASRPSAASGSHRSQASAFSFELADPGEVAAAGDVGDEATSLGRRGSATVDPAVVRDMLDDSIWVESLRRSATTMRKSGWGGQGGFK